MIEFRKLLKKTNLTSIYDIETGLYGHEYLTEQLKDLIYDAQRYEKSGTLLMLKFQEDIYNRTNRIFKGQTLKIIGSLLKDDTRFSDKISYINESSFCLVLPFIDPQAALVVKERLENKIKKHLKKYQCISGDEEIFDYKIYDFQNDSQEISKIVREIERKKSV